MEWFSWGLPCPNRQDMVQWMIAPKETGLRGAFPSTTQRGALRVVLSIGKNARMMRNYIYHITSGTLA